MSRFRPGNPWCWPLGLHLLLSAVTLGMHLVHDRASLNFNWTVHALGGTLCLAANVILQSLPLPRTLRIPAGILLCYLGGFFLFALLARQDYLWGDLVWVDQILLTVFYPITDFLNSRM